jgi:hypothetical protein
LTATSQDKEANMIFRILAAAVLSVLFIFPSGCSLFRAKNKPAAPQTNNVFSLPRGSQTHKTAAKTESLEDFFNKPRVQ